MSYWPLVNSLVKNRLFTTAPDIDEPPFQFIHIMDLSVVDTMLHDSSYLVIHSTEIWAVWRRLGARKFGVSWRSSSTVARARCGMSVHCPAGTKSLPDTPRIAGSSMTSLWRREAASKKTVRDITRYSSFVTTMKLPHVLQVYSTENITEFNLRSGKSEAEVTNDSRLRSTYCATEANYWHTRSTARPLCDSRATKSKHVILTVS